MSHRTFDSKWQIYHQIPSLGGCAPCDLPCSGTVIICKLREIRRIKIWFLQWAKSRVKLAIPIRVNICSNSYFKTADSMLSVSVSWLMLAFVGHWFLELYRHMKSAPSFPFHTNCAHALRNVKWTSKHMVCLSWYTGANAAIWDYQAGERFSGGERRTESKERKTQLDDDGAIMHTCV